MHFRKHEPNNKKASFVKIGAVYTISNMIVRGMVFLTTPIFTRMMSKSEYGQFSGISSWANILSIIVTLNLFATINRAKYDYKDNIMEYMSSMLLLGNFVTAICWGIIELNMSFFTQLLLMEAKYLRCIMFYCMIYPSIQLLLCKFRMYGEYKKVVALTWVTLLSSTLISLLAVALMTDKLAGRVEGYYVFASLINIPFYIYVYKNVFSIKFEHFKYGLRLAIPLIPHELSGILLSSSDRIIINNLCGGTETALYSLAYTISLILSVFLSSLNQAWIPWFYDKLSKKSYETIKKTSVLYIILFCLMCFGLMLIGPDLVLIFGGSTYIDAKYIVPPVCLALMLQFCYTLYVNVEFYQKKTITISAATIFATLINIGLNYLLIPQFGYIIAAYTTVVGYFFMFLFHYIVVRKLIDIRQLFDSKLVIACLVVTSGLCALVLQLYRYNMLRYIVLVSYCLVLVIGGLRNKEKLITFTKR